MMIFFHDDEHSKDEARLNEISGGSMTRLVREVIKQAGLNENERTDELQTNKQNAKEKGYDNDCIHRH